MYLAAFAGPIIPVVNAESEDILILEESEAALVVVAVGALHVGSNPTLVVVLHSGDAPVALSGLVGDESFDEVVLGAPVALVHVDQPGVVGRADVDRVSLGDTFKETSQEDTLLFVPELTDSPTIWTV